MKALLSIFALLAGFVLAHATEHDIIQAEMNPGPVSVLVLKGDKNESARLLKLAPRLISLEKVVISGFTDEVNAANTVGAVAGCNQVREIEFRNCSMQKLPVNLRMLTQIRTFTSVGSTIADGEQFYNTIADMPNVQQVNITGNDFRSLPRSFSRLRVMQNISLINEDLMLANGYDRNTKTNDELRVSDSVQFGFGDDILNLSYTCYNDEACAAHLQMFRDVLQGAYRQSNVFYMPASTRAFHKQHPLVKPPVKGMDIYPDVFTYSAMTGSQLEYGSGTKISIPPMAFEDANGSPVTGNVDITYREFRDPVDILLSGIPMKYDSAGTTGDFESAGMFEINASQNGTEVYLRNNQQVAIDFAVVDTASTFNFYRLDEQNGWQYLESPGSVEQEMIPAVSEVRSPLTSAVQYYISNIWEAAARPLTRDTTSFDRRYSDTAYLGMVKYQSNEDEYYYRNKREASSKLYLRKHGSGDDYTLVRIAGVKTYNKNPELNVYDGYYWKIDGKMSGAQLRTEYGRKTGINDCRIIQEGGEYFMELKYSWGFKRIKAEPVKMTRNKKASYLGDQTKDHLFRQYTKRLNYRRNKHAKDINQHVVNYKREVKRATRDSVRVFERTKPVMIDSEQTMVFTGWNTYVNAERERTMTAQQRAWKATGNVYQALTVSGMGVYNCDQVRRLVNPVRAVTTKVKAAGVAIVPFIIYVIDKARNMVLTYSGNGGGGVPITYGKNATNSLLMVDGTGSLYMSTPEQFNTGVENGNGDSFEGQLISGPDANPETVRQAVFGEE